MDNLTASFGVVLPLMVMMVIGFVASRCGILSQDLIKGMNKLLFHIFLPATVFRQIYSLDISHPIDSKLMAYAVCVALLIIVLAVVLVPKFEKDPARSAVLAQGIFRGNYIIFGLAISESVYGNRALGLSALLVSVINPICNAMGSAVFSIMRSQKGDGIGKVLKDVITTPTIIASLSALILVFTGIQIPEMALDIIGDLGAVATPVALISLGGTFTLSAFAANRKPIFWVTLLKLFLIPAVVLTGGVLLGFRNAELVALFALISVPVASSSFPVASAMGGDSELAAQILISTSTMSILSIFFIVYIMQSFALI